MKYLKVALALFAVTFVFSIINVNAKQTLGFSGIKIPAFKGDYLSSQRDKGDFSLQYIMKTACTDDLTGDGRVINAKAHGMLSGMSDSDVVETKPNVNVSFGSKSAEIGLWRVHLESKKSLPTTATFFGIWTIES